MHAEVDELDGLPTLIIELHDAVYPRPTGCAPSRCLRFLETPHVHHWDSLMVLEETTNSLFPADLFAHPGDQPAMVQENLSKQMCQWYREIGIFAAAEPVLRVVERLEKLNPRLIHPMHGGSLPQEVWPTCVHGLRSEPFAFEGKLFGRILPT